MALLTRVEKDALKAKGLYVNEKCDACGNPILTCVSYKSKDGKETYCEPCGKARGPMHQKIEKEREKMNKQKAKDEGTNKVGGVLRPGTAIAFAYEQLQDGKNHPVKDVAKAIQKKHGVNGMARIQQLQRYGKKKGKWAVTMDEDAGTVKMTLGKGAAKVTAPAPAKSKAAPAKAQAPAKKAGPSPKGKATASDSDASSTVATAVASLVRRTLKDGKTEWTKNKLVEHLKKEHGVLPETTRKALDAELRRGGVTEEEGVLSLA